MQSTADPRWRMANQMITEGKIGHVMQGQTSYYRNSDGGQWRYYPLSKEMTPRTVDWKMFLGTDFGLAPEMPFNRAKYAQWRCYWDFGGGMYTDLFVHQLTHLILAMGVRFPRRVVGAGGLYLEYDGRDVPDMATVVADYDEGCQVLISATMCNDVQLPEVIRGHTATIEFDKPERAGFRVIQQKLEGRPAPPGANRGRRRREVRTPAARRGHPRPVGALHGVRPLAQPRDPLPGRPGLCRDHHGQPGRPVLPRRQGLLLRQGDRRGLRCRRRGRRVGKSEATSAASPTRSPAGRPATKAPCSTSRATRSSKATGSTARILPDRSNNRLESAISVGWAANRDSSRLGLLRVRSRAPPLVADLGRDAVTLRGEKPSVGGCPGRAASSAVDLWSRSSQGILGERYRPDQRGDPLGELRRGTPSRPARRGG